MFDSRPLYDERAKIWYGAREEPLWDPERSIGQIIFDNLKSNLDDVLQISDTEGVSLTSGEALTAATRIAQRFEKMGLHCEDTIGILARNTTYLMPVGVACWFNCTPFHAVNPALDEVTLAKLLALTRPKVIFCDGEDYAKIQKASHPFKPLIYTLYEHLEGVPKVQDLLEPTGSESSYSPRPLTLGGQQTVVIFCSSGTTGFPKAIGIPNNRIFNAVFDCSKEDVLYMASAFDWISGVQVCLASCLTGCTRVISNKPFSAEHFVDIVRRHKVTKCFFAPRYVAALLRCPVATPAHLASINLVGVGGGFSALSSLQSLQHLVKDAKIATLYGLTETGLLTAKYTLDQSTSVGQLMPGIRGRIADEDGRHLGVGEVGEVCVMLGSPWKGYFRNPTATREMRDEEGWLHTGDLGYFDEDQRLHIVDRKKNILKYNGMQYWPTEIEDCIAEMPAVADVCVVGVYDERHGDAAAALVVRSVGSRGADLTEQDVKDYVAKKLLLPHKQLNAGVLFVDALPANNNGKTAKKEAEELFLAKKRTV